MYKVLQRSSWLTMLLMLLSCVTVNIYFPAAAAEKAADSIIEDVWHQKSPQTIVPSKAKVSSVSVSRQLIVALLDAFSGDAYAQSMDFNISTAQIEQIKRRLSNRFTALRPLLDSGAVGLTDNGYLAVRNASAASLAQRGQLQSLVNAQNKDRKALYLAIAIANHQPGWVEQIQQTFASRWISQAQKGWWYKVNEHWIQK